MAVDGTTGYDFSHSVNNLFVDPAGEEPLTRLYGESTGEPTDFTMVVRDKKHLVLREILGSDLNRLTALFVDICERHRRHRDYTRRELHETLREVIACFPVYRIYVRAEAGQITDEDVRSYDPRLADDCRLVDGFRSGGTTGVGTQPQ